MKVLARLFLLFIVLNTNLWADITISPWYSKDADNKLTINVLLFLSSTCPHCHNEDAFFRAIEPQYPWLHVQRYVINEDKNALLRFSQLLTEQKMSDYAVPSAFFCNSRWVGFATAEQTGKDLLQALKYCKQQIAAKGTLTPTAVKTLSSWAHANLFDTGMVGNPTPTYYITAMSFIDATSPCAYFCFLAFLALLFIQDSKKKQILTGILYITAVGLVHFFQQVYTSSFYELLQWLRIPAALTGIFTCYLAGRVYRKQSTYNLLIPLAFVLAFFVQSYQQTCLMNWSILFEQWLHNQQFTKNQVALYETAFQGMYVLALAVSLGIYMLMMRMKRFERFKKRLHIIGQVIILFIAFSLIIYPQVLSNMGLSLLSIAGLAIYFWLLGRRANG